jgi:hypothetical protein
VTALRSCSALSRALPRCGWTLEDDGDYATLPLPHDLTGASLATVYLACRAGDLWAIELTHHGKAVGPDVGTFICPELAMQWVERELEHVTARAHGERSMRDVLTMFDQDRNGEVW